VYSYDFRATGYPFRLYSGKDALERLPAEVERNRARRAFIVCGRTVSRRTPLVSRMQDLLGERLAGVFDEIDKDTSRSSVMRATEAARSAQADLVIGVGAGSVIQGARIVAILLAEKRPVEELVTQYPEHGPAVSPRLLEPKLPIVNVLTAPTTAQNRAGSRMKDDATARGMEFFDPRTRPVAIFWDTDALLTAPPQLIRTGAATIWCRAVMCLGAIGENPLVEGDRLQSYRLAAGAIQRIADAADPAPRFDLCAATLLQNRESDDGGELFARHWAMRVAYAFVTALISVFPRVGQGEGYSALMGTVLRRLGHRDPEAMARIAAALGMDGVTAEDAPGRIADRMDATFRGLGMPTRLAGLGIAREGLIEVLDISLANFNADPKREFVRERGLLEKVLSDAW
jgi:alcohol dehydrogenase class IV